MALKIMLNELGTTGGAVGGEAVGQDNNVVHQQFYNGAYRTQNITSDVRRLLETQVNDAVWLVPVGAATVPLSLTRGVGASGYNTCNFFEGTVVRVLP